MRTILLTRSEVIALLDRRSLIEPLRQAFIAYSLDRGERARRIRARLAGQGTSTVLFPGTAPGVPAYTVKVHAKYPDEKPAIRGILCLHDLASGALLAVMDSTHLTAVRTGLAGALAADTLGRTGAGDVAVVGAGVQGREQLGCLAMLRPLSGVRVYDLVTASAQAFARELEGALGLPIRVADSVEEAVGDADIVLSATWAREPFLRLEMLKPGAHVTTLGPDEPGKAEVSAEVIQAALFVCDDRDLAVEMGAVGGVGLGESAVSAELGEVLGGRHPGRTDDAQLTVFGGVGLAFQDAVAAWAVYDAARRAGAGTEIDFLA